MQNPWRPSSKRPIGRPVALYRPCRRCLRFTGRCSVREAPKRGTWLRRFSSLRRWPVCGQGWEAVLPFQRDFHRNKHEKTCSKNPGNWELEWWCWIMILVYTSLILDDDVLICFDMMLICWMTGMTLSVVKNFAMSGDLGSCQRSSEDGDHRQIQRRLERLPQRPTGDPHLRGQRCQWGATTHRDDRHLQGVCEFHTTSGAIRGAIAGVTEAKKNPR